MLNDSPTIMRRASSSLRADPPPSPNLRSRSSEHSSSRDNTTNTAVDGDMNRLCVSDDDDDDDNNSPQSQRNGETHDFHRAMSDPLDAQEDADSSDDAPSPADDLAATATVASNTNSPTASGPVLPTMPRFPVAETRDQNCWSEPPVDMFSVRGPQYFADKKKVKSGSYIMQARGCDLLLNSANDTSGSIPLEDRANCILGGQLRHKPTVLINFRFPWGYMIFFFEVAETLAPYLRREVTTVDNPNLSVSERTLAQWLLGDTDYKNERLKLIPYVTKGPWVVRNMVTGRPAVIGKKLPVTYTLQGDALFCTLDIGSSSATAKRIVSVCRRYMSALTVDIGFVIQAEEQAELPEQMMGAIRVHHPDPLKAPRV